MGRVVTEVVLLLMLLGMSVKFQPAGVDGRHLINGNLTPTERSVVEFVNGSEAYAHAVDLEKIALSHYAFRSAGSAGADEAAGWIADQFESFGLTVEKEAFEFKTWDLLSKPTALIDDDGNLTTAYDQNVIVSFQCEQYSLPKNLFCDLIVLPLPPAADFGEVGMTPIGTMWDAIDTTGKVVLVGREARIDRGWQESFFNKLKNQTPAAVIHTWWYDWMSFVPDYFQSAGGGPRFNFWELDTVVGFVNYEEGLLIRARENEQDVWAKVVIESVIGDGVQFNVVGQIQGHDEPDKSIVVCGHYDSVMCAGFCDNAAGTAGVIELARVFSQAVKQNIYYPRYSIRFIALAAEELGVVGSINYVMQHKEELKNIVAVLNLDTVGSDDLFIYDADPIAGSRLDNVALDAAEDLGVNATWDNVGGADDRVFVDPIWASNFYFRWWGLNADIRDAIPAKSGVSVCAFPMWFYEKWGSQYYDKQGESGWVHTTYDNSTSTATLDWIETIDLENQLKVTALTAMRVSPLIWLADLNNDGKVDILDITIAATAYNTKPGDEKWNEAADLDKNGTVNILDVTMVAKDYGKTV